MPTNTTFTYDPHPSAFVQAPFNISYLSQRDLGLVIPINYVTDVAVAVTAACFAHGRFEDFATVRCISNLLATGFRRLDVDLYWDVGRRQWGFCPVSLPPTNDTTSHTITAGGALASTPTASSSYSSTTASTHSTFTGIQTTDPATTSSDNGLQSSLPSSSTSSPLLRPRAFGSSFFGASLMTVDLTPNSAVPVTTVTVRLETSGTTQLAVLPSYTPPPSTDEILYEVGPYVCSDTSAAEILAQLLSSFMADTDNTLQAVIQTVILNLHAASPIAAPLDPGLTPNTADLPGPDDLLGLSFATNGSSFLYTPALLNSERGDLNTSWLRVASARPDSNYYNTTTAQGPASGTILTSPNGWPSASVNEFSGRLHRRLLLGFGRIDPQMAAYNLSGDNATIFSPGYLSEYTSTSISAAGVVSTGCIYDADSTLLANANNSFALASIPPSVLSFGATNFSGQNASLPVVANLTECGISPYLNSTLGNTTADVNISAYKEFAYSGIWSWSWGEPLTVVDLRCAVLDPTQPGGQWHVVSCSESHHAACRVGGLPYEWVVGSDEDSYSEVSCPDGASFSVPRTALENRYLLAAYRRSGASLNTSEPVWLNLNSLETQDCWVTGVNSSCPYMDGRSNQAQIYVPTVAGVIILVITVLLILLKCGANRAQSKRKRKGENGWDYEGVPS